MYLDVSRPSTIYIRFTADMPVMFSLTDQRGEYYFFRYLDKRTPRIKFNMLDPGIYKGNVPFEVTRIAPLTIPYLLPTLPAADRDRWKPVSIEYNPGLMNTPAAIYTDTGVIQTGPGFYQYPAPLRVFLLLHEVGHLFYVREEDCDLYALVNYLRMGYNRSMGMYALTEILRRNPRNMERLKSLFRNIQKTQTTPL